MKAFDLGWAHHETSNPLLNPLKGVLHLQWLSLCLTQYFKSLDRTSKCIFIGTMDRRRRGHRMREAHSVSGLDSTMLC